MNIWDLGGHVYYRSEWTTYIRGSDIIIFVVDASDINTLG